MVAPSLFDSFSLMTVAGAASLAVGTAAPVGTADAMGPGLFLFHNVPDGSGQNDHHDSDDDVVRYAVTLPFPAPLRVYS